MWTAINRLLSLKVSDVMSRSLVEVSASQGMAEVAAIFDANRISSAPVIDERGSCIGILSAGDFLRRTCEGETRNAELGDLVGAYMTDAVQSVAPNQSLLNAARIMCADHFHHLPVIEGHRVIGVISTMDIIAAMLNAIEEVAVDELKKS
jgi:CBS domain-containing protein